MARPERHAIAMQERDRRDFHREFTTLRFKPLSEHGSREWFDALLERRNDKGRS